MAKIIEDLLIFFQLLTDYTIFVRADPRISMVHRWGNPSDTPFTFLAFNLNPEGVAAVILGTPTR
jgi:hypothetical protein